VGQLTFDFINAHWFRRIVKKLAQEKSIQKRRNNFNNNPLEKPCPKCSALPEGNHAL
jgi:hypothetical protein